MSARTEALSWGGDSLVRKNEPLIRELLAVAGVAKADDHLCFALFPGQLLDLANDAAVNTLLVENVDFHVDFRLMGLNHPRWRTCIHASRWQTAPPKVEGFCHAPKPWPWMVSCRFCAATCAVRAAGSM